MWSIDLTTSNHIQGATSYGELCGDFSCTPEGYRLVEHALPVFLKKNFKMLSTGNPIFFVQKSALSQHTIKRDRSDMDPMENSVFCK